MPHITSFTGRISVHVSYTDNTDKSFFAMAHRSHVHVLGESSTTVDSKYVLLSIMQRIAGGIRGKISGEPNPKVKEIIVHMYASITWSNGTYGCFNLCATSEDDIKIFADTSNIEWPRRQIVKAFGSWLKAIFDEVEDDDE